MIKKLEFLNDEDKNNLINQNKDMYVIAIEFGLKHNYITFSDTPLPEPEYDIWGTIKEQENKISILEAENENLKEGLRAVLRGDMQSLAYILYPEDFNTFQKAGV